MSQILSKPVKDIFIALIIGFIFFALLSNILISQQAILIGLIAMTMATFFSLTRLFQLNILQTYIRTFL